MTGRDASRRIGRALGPLLRLFYVIRVRRLMAKRRQSVRIMRTVGFLAVLVTGVILIRVHAVSTAELAATAALAATATALLTSEFPPGRHHPSS